jgi:hypothetical protein
LFKVTVYLRFQAPGSLGFPCALLMWKVSPPVSVDGKFFTTSEVVCLGIVLVCVVVGAVVEGDDEPEPPQPAATSTSAATAATPNALPTLNTAPW